MGNLSYEEGPNMEGLRRGTVGEPGGRSWSELEVKSGTESLEGVLAMMEGGICRKWEPGGGISRKGSLERTLGLESGKCMEIGLEEEFARAGPLQRAGLGSGLEWGGAAGVGSAGSPGLPEVRRPGGWTSWEQGWWEYLPSGRIQSRGRGGNKPELLGPIQALVDGGLGGPLPACSGASLVPLSPQVRAPAAHPPKRAGSGGGPWHAGVRG